MHSHPVHGSFGFAEGGIFASKSTVQQTVP